MTITLYAQRYDISAAGFSFQDVQTIGEKTKTLRNDHGDPVEEFEIQFIDGDAIDAELFKALGIHQGNVCAFLEFACDWEEWQ